MTAYLKIADWKPGDVMRGASPSPDALRKLEDELLQRLRASAPSGTSYIEVELKVGFNVIAKPEKPIKASYTWVVEMPTIIKSKPKWSEVKLKRKVLAVKIGKAKNQLTGIPAIDKKRKPKAKGRKKR